MKSVYVASAGPSRHKIGISGNPERRLRGLSGASGYRLTLAHVHEAANAAAIERMVHWLLRAERLHGEWFEVDEDTAKAAILEAVTRVTAGEQPWEPPVLLQSPPRDARWRAWLTPEEMERVAEIDAAEHEVKRLRIERQLIANRALQRARYAEKAKP